MLVKPIKPKISLLLFPPILLFAFLLALFLTPAAALKREEFRTCDQSGFCRRNRAYADAALADSSHASPYVIVPSSIALDNGLFTAHVLNIRTNVLLALELHLLEDSTVRLRINEKRPLKPRYDELSKHILVKKPTQLKAEKVAKGSDGTTILTISAEKKLKVVVTAAPLRIDFFVDNVPVVSLNDRGFFNFEHLRKKEVQAQQEQAQQEQAKLVDQASDEQQGENDLADGNEAAEQQEQDMGLWEETFRSWTDPKPNGPESIAMDISFPGFAHVYGIPEHASGLSLKETRGGDNAYTEPYRLYNLDVFEYEIDNSMALYGSIPFMLAHRGNYSTGVFWMNAAETWVDVVKSKDGKSQSNLLNLLPWSRPPSPTQTTTHTHWISEAGVIDLFVFLGPTDEDVFRQYTSLTGRPAMPAAFSIAYHQCRWNYLNQNDVAEVDAGFDQHDIPYDVIWLDIEHADGKRYMTWDEVKFPDPVKMQDDLAKKGRKLVTIVDPHIKRDDSYYIFKEAKDFGLFVKTPQGAEYDGWCWPGSSSWVDYTNPAAREWWVNKFKFSQYKHTTENLHIWNDMNEPSVFNGPEITMQKEMVHHEGWEHRVLHNVYGMLYHGATAQGLRLRGTVEKRPFVLSRAFFAGTQRHGAIWTGDNMATWEQLRFSNPMLLTIGVSGLPFAGADIGGFFNNPAPELLVRWYQAGAFQPFMRAHAHIDTKRREPWLFGEPYTNMIREAVRERYRLLPYWYTLFFEAFLSGLPVMRPMFVEFPKDEETFAMDDQFMVGAGLLVKPVTTEGAESVEVYLPGDQPWYDYRTHKAYTPGRHTVAAPLDTIPVFVRSGYIIPRRDRLRRSSAGMRLDPFTLVISLDTKGEAYGTLYLDDGETYEFTQSGAYAFNSYHYENGILTVKSLHPVPDSEGARAFARSIEGVRIERLVVIGAQAKPTRVIVRGEGGAEREIEAEWDASAKRITVRDPGVPIAVGGWSVNII